MAASRNRGNKKPKLRDYSHLVLTDEEKKAVEAAAHSVQQHPIVTAILGYVLVEHELKYLSAEKIQEDGRRHMGKASRRERPSQIIFH